MDQKFCSLNLKFVKRRSIKLRAYCSGGIKHILSVFTEKRLLQACFWFSLYFTPVYLLFYFICNVFLLLLLLFICLLLKVLHNFPFPPIDLSPSCPHSPVHALLPCPPVCVHHPMCLFLLMLLLCLLLL